MVVTQLDTDMAHLGRGVRHYRTEDGHYLAVSVDAGITDHAESIIDEVTTVLGMPGWRTAAYTIVAEPTVIIETDELGQAASLDRLHESAPGTSHEDALREAGFELTP